jgi:hypothetical protein
MRTLRTIVVLLMVLSVAMPSYSQTFRRDESDSRRYHEIAAAMEPAAYVSVRLTNGKHLTGTILEVTEDSFRLQRHARIPEPPRTIRFDDLASFERAKHGMNSGLKVLIGVGASVATFVIVMLVGAVAISD